MPISIFDTQVSSYIFSFFFSINFLFRSRCCVQVRLQCFDYHRCSKTQKFFSQESVTRDIRVLVSFWLQKFKFRYGGQKLIRSLLKMSMLKGVMPHEKMSTTNPELCLQICFVLFRMYKLIQIKIGKKCRFNCSFCKKSLQLLFKKQQ